MPSSEPASAHSSGRFRSLFWGPKELRAGWRLLIFMMIVASLMVAKADFVRMLPLTTDPAYTYLVDKTLKFVVFLCASSIVARVEARTLAVMGRAHLLVPKVGQLSTGVDKARHGFQFACPNQKFRKRLYSENQHPSVVEVADE